MITIDSELQKIGQKLMSGYNGSIVAIEPNSGEILCMVTSPNYNPSDMISENRNIRYPILENNENNVFKFIIWNFSFRVSHTYYQFREMERGNCSYLYSSTRQPCIIKNGFEYIVNHYQDT